MVQLQTSEPAVVEASKKCDQFQHGSRLLPRSSYLKCQLVTSLPGEVTAGFVFKSSGNTSLEELLTLNKEVEW